MEAVISSEESREAMATKAAVEAMCLLRFPFHLLCLPIYFLLTCCSQCGAVLGQKVQTVSDTNNSTSNEIGPKPKKKRVTKKPEIIYQNFITSSPPHFRLLPNMDIRYSYPQQIISSLSEGCLESFQKLFQSISTPEAEMFVRYADEAEPPSSFPGMANKTLHKIVGESTQLLAGHSLTCIVLSVHLGLFRFKSYCTNVLRPLDRGAGYGDENL